MAPAKKRIEIRVDEPTEKWLRKRSELREDDWTMQDEILLIFEYVKLIDRKNGFYVR